MQIESLNDMLQFYALILGGLSCAAIAAASFSWRRFRACLNAPLSHSSGDRSEIWAEMFTFSHKAGLGLTGVSILCTVLWCAVEAASHRLCSD